MASLPSPSPEAYRHLLGLRVVRRYRPGPLPPAEIEAILEAGRWTGSSKNRQEWAFVVIEEPAARERLAEAGSFTEPLRESPLVVALVRLPDGNDFDIGRVAQNMMLAAAARGIGSCPITLHHQERAARALDLPEDHKCRWAVAFGYPDAEQEAEQRRRARAAGFSGRKPLAGLVHRERFEAPPS